MDFNEFTLYMIFKIFFKMVPSIMFFVKNHLKGEFVNIEGLTLVITVYYSVFLLFSLKNVNLGLTLKILKIFGIQPILY